MMSSNRSSALHLRNIARTMWRFRTEGFLCDTVLYADDGQEVRAHSIVLAAASPVFRDALRADGSDSNQRTEPHMIQLPGCDLATLEMALHIIYTGSVEDSESMGATTEDLQRVFLLLQQLGVDLDRIEGCSITYVESEEACTGGLKKLSREVKTEDAQSAELEDDSELNETVEPHDLKPEEEDGGDVSGQEADDGVGHIDGTVDNSNEAVAAIISGEEGVVVGAEDPNAIYEILSKVDPNERYYVIVGGDAEDETAGGEEEGYVEERVTAAEGESDMRKVHCPHCGMGFPKVSYLHVHMRKHTGEKPFECDRCGRGFSQRANLQRHVQGHVGEKPYLCFLCGKSFIQKIQLTSHLTQAHSGDDGLNSAGNIKRFKCRICEQVFAERGHLRQHAVKMHPELHREAVGAVSPLDKTHVCDTCGRGYTTMGALRMHMRVHTGELLACNLCEKAYVNRALLEQHLRTHTREKAYECKHCGKAFIYKNALTVHIRTHTGEKPYVCPICHNSYSQFGHLQSHKKTHTGERPYSCTICSKSYRQRVDLRMHLKRVHQDMPPPPTMRHAPVESIKIEEVIIESAD